MKYLRQLLIILIFSFIGEILHSMIHTGSGEHLWTCAVVYRAFNWDHTAPAGQGSCKVSH